MRDTLNNRRGQLSVTVLFFTVIAMVLITGFVLMASSFLQLSVRSLNKAQAFAVAEAGIEYYRWHLAHAPTDYYDGQGSTSTGPYIHSYFDKNGDRIGQFELVITPPPTGSTVVTVRSTGKIDGDASVTKIIEVRLAIPSFAKYALASNDNLRFGAGTEVFGEIYSNGGIRFDGLAHNLVQSAQSSYDDPDHSGGNEFGVHTHLAPTDPLPPAVTPLRPDVFMAGRNFPMPALDFSQITQDLADIRTSAINGGVYATSSGALGYDLVLATSSRYSLYRVTALRNPPWGCSNSQGQTGWGTWSINTETLIASGTLPASGIFFFEDNLWVRGQIDNARLTIAAGRFPDLPATRPSITVNNNLLYTNHDGTDVISLISQNNINIGLRSDDVLRIDGALIAQNGRVGRYYYGSNCSPYHTRNSITSYGMLGSSVRYGFAYTDGTGYQTRNLVYDANLLYSPPPSFPLTSDQYVQISWDEIQ